jgi:hypothetical protein
MRESGDRTENITVAAACSATGIVILPPMTVCKGARINNDLMNGAPKDTIFPTFPKGCIGSDKQNKRKRVMVQL